MRHHFQAVVFDFDYTLADSSRGAIDCINFALAEMGLAQVSAEAACRTIGLSLHETFLTLGEHHEPRRCEFFNRFEQPLRMWLCCSTSSPPITTSKPCRRASRRKTSLGVTPRTQFDTYDPLAVLENVSHLPKIVLRRQKTV